MAPIKTIVRATRRWSLQWLTGSLWHLHREGAARWLGNRFFTPTQWRLSPAGVSILDQGQPFAIGLANEKRVQGWIWGQQGPMVLLVHGWGGRAGQMDVLIRRLVGAGFRVAAFDLPGHGESTRGITNAFEFLEALAQVLEVIPTPQAVIAHSLGAVLAVQTGLWLQVPLVLYSPITHIQDNLMGWASATGLNLKLFDHFFRQLEQHYRQPLSRINPLDRASELKTPVLLLHDHHDKAIAIENSQILADRLPQVKLITSRGLGHNRILEDEAMFQQVMEFFREQKLGQRG